MWPSAIRQNITVFIKMIMIIFIEDDSNSIVCLFYSTKNKPGIGTKTYLWDYHWEEWFVGLVLGHNRFSVNPEYLAGRHSSEGKLSDHKWRENHPTSDLQTSVCQPLSCLPSFPLQLVNLYTPRYEPWVSTTVTKVHQQISRGLNTNSNIASTPI